MTNAGEVPVTVDDGRRATLTSVATRVAELTGADLAALLAALRLGPRPTWTRHLPPRVAYAGAYHPVIAVREPRSGSPSWTTTCRR